MIRIRVPLKIPTDLTDGIATWIDSLPNGVVRWSSVEELTFTDNEYAIIFRLLFGF